MKESVACLFIWISAVYKSRLFDNEIVKYNKEIYGQTKLYKYCTVLFEWYRVYYDHKHFAVVCCRLSMCVGRNSCCKREISETVSDSGRDLYIQFHIDTLRNGFYPSYPKEQFELCSLELGGDHFRRITTELKTICGRNRLHVWILSKSRLV